MAGDIVAKELRIVTEDLVLTTVQSVTNVGDKNNFGQTQLKF